MTLTTAEGATQIGPTTIPRIRQEADFAAIAANHTFCQLRTSLQIAIQNQQILLDKRLGATALMPILPIRENFRNCDDKKAKFSAMMFILFCMTSLDLAEAKASRGKARFFSARRGIKAATLDRIPPAPKTLPDHPSRPGRTDYLRAISSSDYLKEKTLILSNSGSLHVSGIANSADADALLSCEYRSGWEL